MPPKATVASPVLRFVDTSAFFLFGITHFCLYNTRLIDWRRASYWNCSAQRPDFSEVVEFKVWSSLEILFKDLSLAPKVVPLTQLGTEPRLFEIFVRKWGFFNFSHTLLMLVSNCSHPDFRMTPPVMSWELQITSTCFFVKWIVADLVPVRKTPDLNFPGNYPSEEQFIELNPKLFSISRITHSILCLSQLEPEF